MLNPKRLFTAIFFALFLQSQSLGVILTYYHHGSVTANGESFNKNGMTCAVNRGTYRFGTLLKITYRGKSVVVRVNDHCPRAGVIDLAEGAFRRLSGLGAGVLGKRGGVTVQVVGSAKRSKVSKSTRKRSTGRRMRYRAPRRRGQWAAWP